MPIPVGGGGGSVLTQHQSHDMKMDSQAVNATLVMGNQANPAHCYQFHILLMNLQYPIFYNIILGLGKITYSQDQSPGDTIWKKINFFRHLDY